MTTYSQRSQSWAPVHLGNSKYTMADSGCVTTAVGQALAVAGYDVDPLRAVTALNANGCYTDGGLIYFQRICRAFPQFSLSSSGAYEFVQVKWGGSEHWLLRVAGTVYDPWDGSVHPSVPSPYVPTGLVMRASIEAAPNIVTVSATVTVPVNSYDPFLTDLQPSQTYSAEVVRMQHFLTDKGFFQDAGPQDGWYGPRTQKAVHDFQAANGITGATQYGWWYPMTRGKANQQLSINHPNNA